MRSARYLFQVRNRRGLGHLMRGLNIARELRALDAQAEILFYLRVPPPPGFWPPGIGQAVETDPQSMRDWPAVLAAFAPDVVVYDTMLPRDASAEPRAPSARLAYVMRKCREERQREVFEHPMLAQMDRVLVPHTAEEFGYALPEAIAPRTAFVGPIVRGPEAAVQQRLRARYGLGAHDFVLTSTTGGGGFEAQADAFFATVAEAHQHLHAAIPALRHLVVRGPNYAKPLAGAPGMTVIDVEPDLIDLLAVSDAAIVEGGYNTVHELRMTATPAVFLPGERGNDDQLERAQAMAAQGFGFVEPGAAAGERVAARILELYRQPAVREAIRARHAARPLHTGNRAAARLLSELAR